MEGCWSRPTISIARLTGCDGFMSTTAPTRCATGKGKDRSDPAAVYERQLAEIDMDRVVPVKVGERERELRRREEVKLTRQTQTDERVDGRNLKNRRRQLPYLLLRFRYAQSTIRKVR
jgi:hypothetical protein